MAGSLEPNWNAGTAGFGAGAAVLLELSVPRKLKEGTFGDGACTGAAPNWKTGAAGGFALSSPPPVLVPGKVKVGALMSCFKVFCATCTGL